MLGDLVFLRNRSRLGLHALQATRETPILLPLAPKRVNANSNSQAQGSCQPRLSCLHAYGGRLRATLSSKNTLSFFITFKALRESSRIVTQRYERPSGQGAAKPHRWRHPPGGARCRFSGNEWETRRADVPVTPVALAGWRRGWDSNPRYACAYSGFRDRHVQPLRHLSERRILPAPPISAPVR